MGAAYSNGVPAACSMFRASTFSMVLAIWHDHSALSVTISDATKVQRSTVQHTFEYFLFLFFPSSFIYFSSRTMHMNTDLYHEMSYRMSLSVGSEEKKSHGAS
jgi:hypothetical protein